MSFYVVSVQPRREHQFIQSARNATGADKTALHDVTLYWPRRKLSVRRKGRTEESLVPLFPGYIFISAPQITEAEYRCMRRLPGFYRFLESNDNIRELSGRDEEIVAHFIRFGEVIGKSTVTLDRNQRITVLDGPLQGLEGLIVKVDKRKQRAKVRLDLYDDSFLVDFGFDLLAPGATPSRGNQGSA